MGYFDAESYKKQAQFLGGKGLYLKNSERDNCGVGMVAAIDGIASREIVVSALEALRNLWHRGAVDADGKTGDGAGIHLQISQSFFKDHVEKLGNQIDDDSKIAVGMVFLPRTDMSAQERTRQIIESEILALNYRLFGWRQVPINISVIGEKANATRPEIEQIMVEKKANISDLDFERDLYIIRRRIEKKLLAENLLNSYICSLSGQSVIYKGLFLAEQLDVFYPDLQDDKLISNFAIYHQRYSTNTFPSWALAQPFRVLAHNGEVNTLPGNEKWMKSHEVRMNGDNFKGAMDDLKPVIIPGSSDSAALDAVFEIMLKNNRDLPEVKSLMMPEAWENNESLDQDIRDFYQYAHGIMEPWDGPAAICAYHGDWVLAGLDRNGLRPLRFQVTSDNMLVVGSEAGMVRLDEQRIIKKGRVGPGQMIGINFKTGEFYHCNQLKEQVAASKPFGKWVKNINTLKNLDVIAPPEIDDVNIPESLHQSQIMAGWSMEDIELILKPLFQEGKEATGSMGDDSPLAILANRYKGFHHFFRQNFAQVTNPPIDSLRERHVMSLTTRFGNLGNILEKSEEQMDIFQLESPVLLNNEMDALIKYMGDEVSVLDCTMPANTNDDNKGVSGGALRTALTKLQEQAAESVASGKTFLLLDNLTISDDRIPIPSILAAGVVHTYLVNKNFRTFASINLRASDVLDVHHFAVLVGVGATTVNACTAEYSIADYLKNSNIGDLSFNDAVNNYRKSINDGLLKIMSKMGISVISSYRGGYIFEALGLSRPLVNEFFPGLLSRISGIGLHGIEHILRDMHKYANNKNNMLPVGGYYRVRQSLNPNDKNDDHAWESAAIHLLQHAVNTDSYLTYKKYAQKIYELDNIHLRDLLDFQKKYEPIKLNEVETITEIRKKLVAPGISLGALSPIAHETLSIAMNRIGAKSDSGEGGEDPIRYKPKANGDNASSAIKQIASGRFGVTTEYLNNCKEIEIKMAQGAKPGEGGQLPGFKVSKIIARLRHSTEGVTLISPPPHHDIYSIEDLAQLIYDLKQVNPKAKVCVKLVARSGIGTIAAGVAKAHADAILISGHSGGTGASPQTSIKYAGLPWELGLSETHQVLCLNNLRDRVTLRADGGIKTGRDVVIAAMLGAEEFGIGTGALIAMGCLMVRQCHSNTCPVGVCTQNPKLIEKFTGTPEKVVNLYSFIAEEVREILASLGMRSLQDVIGRTDLLKQINRGRDYLDDLDLNPLLVQANSDNGKNRCSLADGERNEVPSSLDIKMIKDAKPLFDAREKMQLQYDICNTDRAVGTRISSEITRKFGMNELDDGHLHIKLRGSAGQSLGAFLVKGILLGVRGEANDYVGKGLSGGEIYLRAPRISNLVTRENTIIGNTCLYGATSGHLYAAGQAGERFAVRNSGAISVIEGCGSNGCEYMTGGEVMILGQVGHNFAAGMTGGWAFVLDINDNFPSRINNETVGVYKIKTQEWQNHCLKLLERHVKMSQSKWGEEIINNWQHMQQKFYHIVPHEIKKLGKLPYSLDNG